MIVITDLNEYAWKCYKLFKQAGYAICVIGEKWEWFGFCSGDGYLDYPDYAKMYVYAEGTEVLRNEKEFEKSYYLNVSANFWFLWDAVNTNAIKTYQKEMRQLEQRKVAICECCVPTSNEVLAKTNDEEQSIKLDVGIAGYSNDLPDAKKECLYNIYGKQKVISLEKYGLEKNVKRVPLGEMMGRSMKNVIYMKRIYLIGPCIVAGLGCFYYETLLAYLQEYVNKYEYQVVAIPFESRQADIWKCVSKLPIREKDIVININDSSWFLEQKNMRGGVNLKSIYEIKDRSNLFYNIPLHTNPEGNRLIAKEIMEKYLDAKMKELSDKKNNKYIQKGELLSHDGIRKVNEYVESIRIGIDGDAGAIVMNGNPFTKGHRYLIEYASKTVEKLYVFVVEEDKSYFKFDDRFEMIKRGTGDISNVIVIPSGEWVLSYKTMPSYFEKEGLQKIKVSAEYDLEIFARYVAPGLGIVKRFVGEEPFDAVTRQYNEQMTEILMLFDIEVEEIPRTKVQGEVISASLVRECMKRGDWEKLANMVPDTTYEVCKKYYCEK